MSTSQIRSTVSRVVAPGLARRGPEPASTSTCPSGEPSARRTSSASARVHPAVVGDHLRAPARGRRRPRHVSAAHRSRRGCRYSGSSQPCRARRNGVTMSDFTGPGRNSEMSMMRSSKVSGANLPTSSRWPGRLDLEHAEGVGDADQPEGRPRRRAGRRRGRSGRCWGRGTGVRLVASPDAPGLRRVRAVDPGDLVEGVGHRRLHPDPEDVELEQAELLDVVLVELAHREPQPARLDRGAVEQAGVGQDHPARVQGDVPGQPVEPLDQVEEQVEPGGQPGRRPAARAARASGVPDVAGPDVRERLGDRVDLAGRQAERGTDVADRVPDPVGVHHRHAGHPLGAEPCPGSPRRPRSGGRTRRRCRCPAAGRAAGTGTVPSAGRAAGGRPRRCRAGG